MKKILLIVIFIFSCFSITKSQNLSPILVEPPTQSDMISLTVTLDWSDFEGAQYYTIDISQYADFHDLIPFTLPNPTVSYYTIPAGVLSPFTTYYWKVSATTSTGPTSFSPAFSFKTIGSAVQEIGNLQDAIDFLVNGNIISQVQGNILHNRLESANHQVNLGHKFAAIVHMNTFKFRVNMLVNSLLLGDCYGNYLINHANGVIQLIQGDNPETNNNQNSPSKFALEQNYPNPFNPSTTIEYAVPENGNVNIKVFDITGKEVSTLIDKYQNAGSYIVVWNASGFSSGIYFCRLESNGNIAVKRMVLTK